jgi:hypothetical protein
LRKRSKAPNCRGSAGASRNGFESVRRESYPVRAVEQAPSHQSKTALRIRPARRTHHTCCSGDRAYADAGSALAVGTGENRVKPRIRGRKFNRIASPGAFWRRLRGSLRPEPVRPGRLRPGARRRLMGSKPTLLTRVRAAFGADSAPTRPSGNDRSPHRSRHSIASRWRDEQVGRGRRVHDQPARGAPQRLFLEQ